MSHGQVLWRGLSASLVMIAAVKDDTLGNMFNILSISSFGAPFEVWTSKTCLEKKKTPK